MRLHRIIAPILLWCRSHRLCLQVGLKTACPFSALHALFVLFVLLQSGITVYLHNYSHPHFLWFNNFKTLFFTLCFFLPFFWSLLTHTHKHTLVYLLSSTLVLPVRNVGLPLVEQAATGLTFWMGVYVKGSFKQKTTIRTKRQSEEAKVTSSATGVPLTVESLLGLLGRSVWSSVVPCRRCICWTTGER